MAVGTFRHFTNLATLFILVELTCARLTPSILNHPALLLVTLPMHTQPIHQLTPRRSSIFAKFVTQKMRLQVRLSQRNKGKAATASPPPFMPVETSTDVTVFRSTQTLLNHWLPAEVHESIHSRSGRE